MFYWLLDYGLSSGESYLKQLGPGNPKATGLSVLGRLRVTLVKQRRFVNIYQSFHINYVPSFFSTQSSIFPKVDQGKARLTPTLKNTRKLESSSTTKSSVKAPSSPLLTMHYLARQRSQSEGSESEPPSPPPSVWKVPEYVEPKWNPGKPESKARSKETRLNNDIVCAKVKLEPPFNQLHNPVYNSQAFKKNHFMNQNPEKSQTPSETKSTAYPAEFAKVKDMDKPDNRQVKFTTYSSFSGLDLLSQLKDETKLSDTGVKSYSLFGPDEPNSTIFRSPLTGL